MTASRYHPGDRLMDDAAELNRANLDRCVVGVPQVWHRCAVLLGWRWQCGQLVHPDYDSSPDDVEQACAVFGVETVRQAYLLLKEAGG